MVGDGGWKSASGAYIDGFRSRFHPKIRGNDQEVNSVNLRSAKPLGMRYILRDSRPFSRPLQFPVKPSFSARLGQLRDQKSSVLCVGLDPDPDRLPPHLLASASLPEAVRRFCTDIICATHEAAIAYKINFAFFEALGREGHAVMEDVLSAMPPAVLTIADAKRGDIGNSASFYARSVFETLHFDAITVSPYMGRDSVDPFLAYDGTCAFMLVRTSNPGSADFQQLDTGGQTLYREVARKVSAWGREASGEAGFVVGATDAGDLATLRASFPDTPFLIPGVGAQGGSATEVMQAAGSGPVLINSSRGVIYASNGEDYAEAAAAAAQQTRKALGT